MLATGGSCIRAIEVLLAKGVLEERIFFLNILSVPVGIHKLLSKFPKIKIITADIDPELNENKFIVPGLGDFGCRYFGTD